jgi:hypothetical protein
MNSQLVEKFSSNSSIAVEQSRTSSSFEDSLVQFEKNSQQLSDCSVKPESTHTQIGMIGFNLLEAKQLENTFRSSYNQLTAQWQLSPSSKHRYTFVNCSSRLGREYLFGVLSTKREQLPYLILVVSAVSALKEFGITGEDRCLVATTPLQSSAIEFCLNSLAERRKARRPASSGTATLTTTMPDKSASTVDAKEPKFAPIAPKLVEPQAISIVPNTPPRVLAVPSTGAEIDQPTFGLTTFPPVAILSLHRSHVRLSALMLHKPRAISELAADTKITELVVRHFFEKCRDAKILVVHPVKDKTNSQTTLQVPTTPVIKSIATAAKINVESSAPSMLGRLRAKFGF